MAASSPFDTPPPPTQSYILTLPAPHVLQITISRPAALNSLPYAAHWEAARILAWYDASPSLRACVITGSGERAFCCGQDLKEQDSIVRQRQQHKQGSIGEKGGGGSEALYRHPPEGFMAVSRRRGKKPIIAAVNGYALGGGFEIVLGCDIVIAAPRAIFGLPEASRGLYAAAGGLSRLIRVTGRAVASEIAMAGRQLSAEEAVHFGVANRVASSNEHVVREAVDVASRIAALSPDAIIITRQGLLDGLYEGSVETATQRTDERWGIALRDSENLAIGLAAFAEKKTPAWVPSKL